MAGGQLDQVLRLGRRCSRCLGVPAVPPRQGVPAAPRRQGRQLSCPRPAVQSRIKAPAIGALYRLRGKEVALKWRES